MAHGIVIAALGPGLALVGGDHYAAAFSNRSAGGAAMPRTLPATLAVASLAWTAACAQEAADGPNRAEIEQVVRSYLLENPEVIEEALIALQAKREREEAENAQAAIAQSSDALYRDARDFSIGPDDAPVTVVEFFDYRCGFCKASADWVNGLPEEYDGQVRVIFKEFPILTAESRVAARAALAAGEQGKYAEMHVALMNSRTELTSGDIERIAEDVGVDVALMQADMDSLDVQRHVADVRALADAIGTSATPTFIVNGEMVQGFNRARLDVLIADAVAQAG